MKFLIKNVSAEIIVAEYEAEALIEPYLIDSTYSGTNYVTVDENGVEIGANILYIWTPYEFLNRIPQNKRIIIRNLAKTVPEIEDYLELLKFASEVRSDNLDVINGIEQLKMLGVLTEDEVSSILGRNN